MRLVYNLEFSEAWSVVPPIVNHLTVVLLVVVLAIVLLIFVADFILPLFGGATVTPASITLLTFQNSVVLLKRVLLKTLHAICCVRIPRDLWNTVTVPLVAVHGIRMA